MVDYIILVVIIAVMLHGIRLLFSGLKQSGDYMEKKSVYNNDYALPETGFDAVGLVKFLCTQYKFTAHNENAYIFESSDYWTKRFIFKIEIHKDKLTASTFRADPFDSQVKAHLIFTNCVEHYLGL